MRILQSLLRTKYNSKTNRIFANFSKIKFINTNKVSNGLIKRKFSTSIGGGGGPNNNNDEKKLLISLACIYLCFYTKFIYG